MSLSIRNQLSGTVVSIVRGTTMAAVKTLLSGGQQITAAVPVEALDELGLEEGGGVRALVMPTDVVLATGPIAGITIRNQLSGTIASVAVGPAMASVSVRVAGGELMATVTREAVEELHLAEGSPVTALIKSTEVALTAL